MNTTYIKRALLAVAVALLAIAPSAHAQQSYTVSGPGAVFVEDPTKHAQYNSLLNGNPAVYQFVLTETKTINIQMGMPIAADSKKDVMAALLDPNDIDQPLAVLDASSVSWNEQYNEPKTGRPFMKGPSLEKELAAGAYEIRIWSSNNDSPYAIVFGQEAAPVVPPTEAPKEGPSVALLILIAVIAGLLGSFVARRRMRQRHVAQVQTNEIEKN